MKKTICLICVFALLLGVFSGCGYRISIEKKDKNKNNGGDGNVSDVSDIPLPTGYDIIEVTTEEPTTEAPATDEATTADPLEAMGIFVEGDYRAVAMDSAAVLDFYTSAVNNVKLRCPGFTKREYQELGDVVAGNGTLNLANRILNLVGTELVKSSGSDDSELTVKAHNDVAVRNNFPVFGEEYGARVTDMSIIKNAFCYTDGKQYKIVITFNDQLNPEPKKCDFGNIMTPIERQNVANGIEEYVVVIDSDAFKFDFNYTGCEIICYVDVATGRITSLTQKMIIDIDIDLDIDVIFFKTNIVKAKGSLVNHLEYTDFDWSE